MKFDVVREVDYLQGRSGPDAPKPLSGAVFNYEENRWELEINSMEDLMKVINEVKQPLVIEAHPDAARKDMAMLYLTDAPNISEICANLNEIPV